MCIVDPVQLQTVNQNHTWLYHNTKFNPRPYRKNVQKLDRHRQRVFFGEKGRWQHISK